MGHTVASDLRCRCRHRVRHAHPRGRRWLWVVLLQVILMAGDGALPEGTQTNFFAIKDGTLCVPWVVGGVAMHC